MFWQIIAVLAIVFLASIAGSVLTLSKTLVECKKEMSALFALLIMYIPTKKKETYGYAG